MKAHTLLLIALCAAPPGLLDKEIRPDSPTIGQAAHSEEPSSRSFFITELCQDLADEQLKACSARCTAQNRRVQFDPGVCGIRSSCKCA